MNINVIQFASDDIENKLASLSDNEIDKLAFGAIEDTLENEQIKQMDLGAFL